jgi:hypothetical protein
MNFGLERKKDTTIFDHIQLNIILKIFFPFLMYQKMCYSLILCDCQVWLNILIFVLKVTILQLHGLYYIQKHWSYFTLYE